MDGFRIRMKHGVSYRAIFNSVISFRIELNLHFIKLISYESK